MRPAWHNGELVTNATKPYTVELTLARATDSVAPPGVYELTLSDRERAGRFETGSVSLDFAADAGFSKILTDFLDGRPGGAEDGLRIGQALIQRLFGRPPVSLLWEQILSACDATKRSLRLELVLPAISDADPLDAPLDRVGDLPFELLTRDRDFLFRSYGSSLIRSLAGHERQEHSIAAGARVAVIWANPLPPDGTEPLPAAVFEMHEQAMATLAREGAAVVPLEVLPPCREATIRSVKQYLEENQPIEVVSIVAHGSPSGGSIALHADDHPEHPRDPGAPLDGVDLGYALRKAGVKAALLWSCHGGRRHRVAGAVVEHLLDPRHGGLVGVVASHAALVAEDTSRLAAALVAALRGVAGGHLEQAVSEARHILANDHLSWAAPVYYARPASSASSVRWDLAPASAEIVESSDEVVPRPTTAVELEGGKPLTPLFRGRDQEVARGLDLVRSRRLVSVRGLPGIGKTEVAIAIAAAALADPELRFDRALWLALDGVDDVGALRSRLALSFGLEVCDDDDQLAAAIGSTRTLVLLDNAEDLIRPRRLQLQALVAILFRRCPGLRLVLSTRTRLGDIEGIADEAELEVMRLPPPHDRELFVAAADVRLGYDERGSSALAALVEALGGHPRSLLLIAGQVGRRGDVATLRSRLAAENVDDVIAEELLGDDVAHTPDNLLRSKRLISSMNLSYAPLLAIEPLAAEVFDWLAVFPAGMPAVVLLRAFGSDASEAMAALQRHNLVELRGRDRRLDLPAPLRWYAARKLAEQPSARRAARLDALLASAARWSEATYDLAGRTGARTAYDRATVDEPNVRGLLGAAEALQSSTTESRSAPITNMVTAWARTMAFAGRARAAIDPLTRAYALAASDGHKASRANGLKALGDLYVRTARLGEALVAYEQALPIYRDIDARLGEANTLQALGSLALAEGSPSVAFARFLEALAIHRSVQSELGAAGAHGWLSRASAAAEQFDRASFFAHRALTALETIDSRFGQLLALDEIARALGATQDEEGAIAAAILAAELASRIDDQSAADRRAVVQPIVEAIYPDGIDAAARQRLRALLDDSAAAAVERMRAAGIDDPYSPLEPT